MKRNGPSVELKTLERTVREIEKRFLTVHLGQPTLSPPSRKEILDVAAYVVLVHGALENFVEGLAQWALNRSVSSWTLRKRLTRSTVSLLLYQKIPPDRDTPLSAFDNIRTALDAAKARMSKAINDNHGIDIGNLQTLFVPLGVNVPADPIQIASLAVLIKMRHEWAHQDRKRAKVVKSAADARTTVSDCLAFAKKLSSEIASVRP